MSKRESPSAEEMKQAHTVMMALLAGCRLAQKVGGKNATIHAGDVIMLIEHAQAGKFADGAPVTGPFYPRDTQ